MKEYDVIMIASWLKLKRHELLFKSIAKIKRSVRKVVLVGYPASDRTIRNVIRDSDKYNVTHLIQFYEKISQLGICPNFKKIKNKYNVKQKRGG